MKRLNMKYSLRKIGISSVVIAGLITPSIAMAADVTEVPQLPATSVENSNGTAVSTEQMKVVKVKASKKVAAKKSTVKKAKKKATKKRVRRSLIRK